ncbi:putative secreted protein [Rhodopirellula maiorica SM1]|uniref:Putative secreted protein n=1 Tax=Rhodopirellula maiorica SM1 TaxID=1265738 RepID=M5RSF3_9BACT|nr:hypothetical protein [Rhodopirellula maiorica]EMI18292.1 putative secreted protein [Rhodopirellula maiorica SM1]
MPLPLDRRQFAVGSAAILSGTLMSGDQVCEADEPSLQQKRLVLLGLNALARAPEMNYFADGHRGAAMISAHMMCVDNDLDDAAATRIVQLFDRNWAPTKLCKPFAQRDPVPDAAEQVGKALAENSGVLREVGHDAIFAMHAIKAFRMLPEAATRQRVDGVCNLIRAIKPWRDVEPDDGIDPPPFTDSAAASKFVLQEASDAIDRFVGFGQGFAGHMLTFGQSLIEMAAMGDAEWAESCRIAFRKYVTVTRQGPDSTSRKIADHKPSELRPKDARYWQQRGDKTLGIGHVFKYPYAYYDLLARANDPLLAKKLDAKAYHLF